MVFYPRQNLPIRLLFLGVTLWEAKVLDNRNDAVLASPVVIGWINLAACARRGFFVESPRIREVL